MSNDNKFLCAALESVRVAGATINSAAALFGFSLTGNAPTDTNTGYPILSPDEKDAFVRYLLSLGYRCHLVEYNPTTDGLNHYNIYSQARTTIGKMASNFYSQADGEYFYTGDGDFLTLEGYYHYLRIVDYAIHAYCKGVQPAELDNCDAMRAMVKKYPDIAKLAKCEGSDCIRLGRSLKASIYGGTTYRPGAFSEYAAQRFMTAMVFKLYTLKIDGISIGNILSALTHLKVPLLHYYVMNGRQITPPHAEWLPGVIEEIVQYIDPYGTTFDPVGIINQLGKDDGSV